MGPCSLRRLNCSRGISVVRSRAKLTNLNSYAVGRCIYSVAQLFLINYSSICRRWTLNLPRVQPRKYGAAIAVSDWAFTYPSSHFPFLLAKHLWTYGNCDSTIVHEFHTKRPLTITPIILGMPNSFSKCKGLDGLTPILPV